MSSDNAIHYAKPVARVSIALLFAATLAACSTTKQAAPAVRTIAVIPAADPAWFSLRNRNAISLLSPIVDVGNSIDSGAKAQALTMKMLELKTQLGDQLTTAMVEALNEQGFQASVVPPSDLEGVNLREIDYEQFNKTAADAVMHLYFSDVGVYSGYSTVDYLPRANVTGYLFRPRDGSYIHEETVYYGVDAREGKAWGVRSDPKYAYRSFEVLLEKAPELAAALREGSRAAARRMAENVRKAVRTP